MFERGGESEIISYRMAVTSLHRKGRDDFKKTVEERMQCESRCVMYSGYRTDIPWGAEKWRKKSTRE